MFGIPGVHTLEIYRGLAQLLDPPRHPPPRAGRRVHGRRLERASAGKPGVCVVITGPGVTNVLTPIGQAAPRLHAAAGDLVEQPSAARSTARGPHPRPARPARALTARVTAFSHTVGDPDELADAFAAGVGRLRVGAGRGRCTSSVPIDVLELPAAGCRTALDRRRGAGADPGAANWAAADLLAARRAPVVLLGGGAVAAGDEALAVAERLGAPIGLTHQRARAPCRPATRCRWASAITFPPVQRLLLGRRRGAGRRHRVLRDRLLLVPDAPAARSPARWCASTSTPSSSTSPAAPTSACTATPRPTLAALADALGERRGPTAAARAEAMRDAARPRCAGTAPYLPSPRAAGGARRGSARRPASSPPTPPSPPTRQTTAWPARRPRTHGSCRSASATLGCALPMAIGAKLAAPDRAGRVRWPATAACCSRCQELATARDLGPGAPAGGLEQPRLRRDPRLDGPRRHRAARRHRIDRAHDLRHDRARGSAARACGPTAGRHARRLRERARRPTGPTLIEVRP